MKKVMILLAVATLSVAPGCCATRLCPCCPCNWFARPAATCCPPAPMYAAPVAATCAPTYMPSPCAPACPSPCSAVGTVSPMAGPMQFMGAPQGMPMVTQGQPMYYQSPMPQTCCGSAEPNCSCMPSCGCGAEAGCGGPFMGNVGYGPSMDCGGCGSCNGGYGSFGGGGGCSGCDGGGAPTAAPPAPEKFDPVPAAE